MNISLHFKFVGLTIKLELLIHPLSKLIFKARLALAALLWSLGNFTLQQTESLISKKNYVDNPFTVQDITSVETGIKLMLEEVFVAEA